MVDLWVQNYSLFLAVPLHLSQPNIYLIYWGVSTPLTLTSGIYKAEQ